jgi:hypothetical protein
MALVENIIPNIIWDAIKGLGLAIPNAITNYKFKKFFGSEAVCNTPRISNQGFS